MEMQEKRRCSIFLGFLVLIISWIEVKSKCSEGCDALASYYTWEGTNLTFISSVFSTTINDIVGFNPQISNPDFIQFGIRVNVPFTCGCINGEFMGHQFIYQVKPGNYYQSIAELYYSNLTTVEMITRFNSYEPENVPDTARLNIIVNCSCGNSRVSKEYGLFITYPLRPGEDRSSISNEFGLPEMLLQDYNLGIDFSRGSGLLFIPRKDQNGTYRPFKSSWISYQSFKFLAFVSNVVLFTFCSSSGISGGAIADISVAAVVGATSLAVCIYAVFYRRKKAMEGSMLHDDQNALGPGIMEKTSESGPLVASASPKINGITVDKSVEFTFEELAVATNDFNLSCKIGQGGFGSVYYGELRGEKAAIKKMDMQASKEFLAELKVLTHVHHVNLVHLIGYCVEGSLFLVYEYIDNGNLSQHLRRKETEPLPWSTRVQIALDSARGLEYIHEHTVPVYIHRDIKPANILIDKNFRAKVADFGLAKLTEVGSASLQTQIVGTFGYMPPEYAQYGDVSPKIDVYAFGVLLFELISAKEAIVKTNEIISESKGLVALFEDAFNQPDQTDYLQKLVDLRLGDDCPLDSVSKVAHLAKACTHENPQLRPSMRSIVVALMTLSSSTEDWDIGSFYENQDRDGRLTGNGATSFFAMSNLSKLLKQVWETADSKRQVKKKFKYIKQKFSPAAMQLLSLAQQGHELTSDLFKSTVGLETLSPPSMEGLDALLTKSRGSKSNGDSESNGSTQLQPTPSKSLFSTKFKKKNNTSFTAVTSVVDGLKILYNEKLKPLEATYRFNDFVSPILTGSDFDAKPMVMLLGQYSTGKTTFIKHLLQSSYPGAHIGPEPTTDRFIVVMSGPDERSIPGNTIAVRADLPFTGLTTFGGSFLSKFECSQMPHPLLEHITFVDTPGVPSGEKQRTQRNYDFTGVISWFAAKCDLILLLFDPHKLDISDELKRVISSLRGHDDKIRVVLNKADQVDTQQLMRVYGALMWSLEKVLNTPEVARVYIGSFNERPVNEAAIGLAGKELFEKEQYDLLLDLIDIPKKSCDRRINEFLKRARAAKIHAYIISHLKKEMPALMGKAKAQRRLIKNLENVFTKVQREFHLPEGDFPSMEHFREVLTRYNIDDFEKLKPKMIQAVDDMLSYDIPELLKFFKNLYD